jgi:uncharacterized protein HemY
LKRENVAFLVGGLAFGILFGFGLGHALATRPGQATAEATGEIPSPAGPPAPGQIAGGGGGMQGGGESGAAPMLQEIQQLQQAAAAHPEDPRPWTRLANLYHDAGMFPQATGFYEKAVALVPGDPNLLTDLGVCYRRTGATDKALEMFTRAEKADPRHWQCLYNQVIVYGLDLGRHAEAEAALSKLEKVNPQAPGLPALRQAVEQARAGLPAGGSS